MDKNLRIVLINSAFINWLHRLGVKTDILGITVFEAFPFLLDKVRAEYAYVFDTRETLFSEESNIIDGVEIITETRKIPIIKEGRVDQVMTVIRDITISKSNEKKIKESEEKYRELVDNANSIILKWDKSGRVIFINEYGERFFGYSKDELIGNHVIGTIVPTMESSGRDLEELMRHICANPDKYAKNEREIITKQGKKAWISWTNKAILDDGKNIIGILSIGNDITERKKAEEDLKESTHKLEIMNKVIRKCNEEVNLNKGLKEILDLTLNLTNFFGGGIYLVDKNRGIADLACVQNLPQDFIDDAKEAPIEKGAYKQIFIEGKAIFASNYADVNPERAQKWGIASIASVPLFSEEKIVGALNIAQIKKHEFLDGEKEILMSIGREIGVMISKIKAQEELKESEEKYRNLFDHSPYYILLIDEQWKILDCNPVTKDILGYSKEELTHKNLYDIFLLNKDTENILKQRTKAIINDKRLDPIELKTRRKDGTEIDVKSQSSLVQIGNQKYIQIIGQDITNKKLKELELIRSEKKYYDAYNRAEIYKDLFTHDMSNALQGILSAYDLIKLFIDEGNKQKEILELLKIIEHQIDKSEKLISNVQTLSQLEIYPFVIKKIDLINLLNNTIKFVTNSLSNKQSKIQLYKSSEKIVVFADELLQDVVENLLSNAITYNKNLIVEILIKISIVKENEKNFCKIEFIDNGNGIIDDQKISLFQRTQDRSKNVIGLGLGLLLVSKIVSSYNGRIWVEDRIKGDYSKGSNFIVLIPSAD